MPDRPRSGCLLVAVPGVLEDPNFRRTVVLLLEHGPDSGALGVVLNRPLETPVDEPFPGWEALLSGPPVLFCGGPVAPSMVIALGRPRPGATPAGWEQVLDDGGHRLGTVDLRREVDDLAPSLEQLRVFAGYSGWSPGQLEGEIDQGAWFVVGAEPWDPFDVDPDQLWRQVLRRQGGAVAAYANYPADPSAN
ncbi:MAG: YqgE/AlgH family protein [Acidimicrobiales bacterium]